MEFTAYIGLGSNIEPRVRSMLLALHRLSQLTGVAVVRVSSVYQSAAHTIDRKSQQNYLNAVAMVRTDLTPTLLLARCLEIEKSLGRNRTPGERWKSRTIDLDILLFSNSVLDGPNLRIPHPALSDRLFVLLPLAELIPPARHLAALDANLADLIHRCPDRGPTWQTVVHLGNYK